MQVLLNGKNIELDGPLSLIDLLNQYAIEKETPGIAVAVNSCLKVRSTWGHSLIADGDRVEIVHAVQGG